MLQYFCYRNGKVDFFTRPVHPTLGGRHSYVVAIFNRSSNIFCKYFPASQSRCEDCGLPLRVLVTGGWLGVFGGRYAVSEVWAGRSWGELGPGKEIEATVPPMGVTLLR